MHDYLFLNLIQDDFQGKTGNYNLVQTLLSVSQIVLVFFLALANMLLNFKVCNSNLKGVF